MRRWLALGLVLGIAAAACSSTGSRGRSDGKLGVVAAFYPVAAAAQRIGDGCVSVENLTPAGAEPHDLELVPDQVDKIQNADVVLVMGHGFQPALEKAAGQRNGPTVKLLDHVPSRPGDPHVWLDPDHYSRLVDAVTVALVKADPKCTATLRKNAKRYQAEVARVGVQYADGLRQCKRNTIVTSHEAFGYLAARYHLTQKGITGIAPDQEPNAQRMGELAKFVHDHGVTTIFTEQLVSPRVADALAREAGGLRTETLNPLEGLTDRELARGDDWASVMRTNLGKIRVALGCSTAR